MIDTELREAMSTMLRMMREDIPVDISAFDYKPFNGATVATQFGILAAQVDAAAKILEIMLHDGRTRPDGSVIA